MFSRNRSTATSDSEPAQTEPAQEGPVGKGRPTPKRKQVEAARKRPLGATDRKSAVKAQRAAAKEQREREYRAMQTGDERHLPARDKGPVKKWVRNYVDARRSLGEYFLPISLVMVLSTLLTASNPAAGVVVILALYVVVLATVLDAFILSRILKKKLRAKFGEDKVPRGALMYGVLRAFQIRRTRLPKPQVKRGEFPA